MTSFYRELCFLIKCIDSLEIEDAMKVTIHATIDNIIRELLHKN